MINFSFESDSMKEIKKLISKMEERIEEGKKFVLLEIAGSIIKNLQQINPEINEVKYAEDLEIGFIGEISKGENGVVIFHKAGMRNLGSSKNEKTTGLTIVPKRGSPKYINVLSKYSPWSVSMLPLKISNKDAVVISKFYSQKDLDFYKNRIIQNKREIEKDFIKNGLEIKITDSDKGEGSDVYDDLSYSILRLEFGYGDKKKAHWRPAIKKAMKELKIVKKNFVNYVITGNRNLFEIPVVSDISKSDIKKDNDFQEKIVNMSNLK